MAESKSLKKAVQKEVAEAATEASTGNVETRKAPPEPKGDHVEKIARSRR
jgi:hypothetical protein